MWKGYYGKEPFDLRLTALRMLYKLPLIAAAALLGAVVFGGGYYGKNVLLRGDRLYAATSVYRVEYAVDNVEDMMNVYVNDMSWNTYLQSKLFLGAVQGHLARAGAAGMGEEELAGAIQAQVLSDIRIPSTVVTTDSPEKSLAVARAVEEAMTRELAELLSEVDSVAVIDPCQAAPEVVPDVRPGRAFLLAAVLSCSFAVVALLLKETGEDSIWLPGSVWKRYGLKTVGTIESRELAENVRYFFSRKGQAGEGLYEDVAVCAAQEGLDAEEVLERLKEACPGLIGDGWFAVPWPVGEPEAAGRLRKAGGILLAVRAGSHAGRALERTLEYLGQQDCPVTAAILWEADERLIRRYYLTGARSGGGKAGTGSEGI